ncbi:pyruvate kinase [Chondromyces apiculatus]|uniref:Pyruvate kinase n=1 Tax=Chondromyces apiculatus DSM 436 TaxID=1192034 RepID=A0A017T5W5_9BACT|nr:pyruvate kinase [Chondromyces apiculatus]EYF04648.1 Pyruvate kinase [Chondromyces apiculatus DSM 436]
MLVRRAKIVCTIGPSCDDQPALEQLIRAGMDVARLNFSHGSHEEHGRRLNTVRAAADACGKPVAILQDLCGPKIRAGKFVGGGWELETDSVIWLTEATKNTPEAPPGEIPILYEGLAFDLQQGDVVLIDDGRIIVTVTRTDGERVQAIVTQGGKLRDRVGVSLPARRVRIATLTEKDKADLAFGLSHGVDYVALSFVREADDIRLVRDICEAWGRPTPIVAKIETPSAIDNLESIILATDGVMVARGDLGVEFNPERVPIIQREILGLARTHQKPVIVATEMLQSMVTATRPTRAESSDVATAVFDGTDAVMLSQETATGNHPSLVARMMARIITEAEQSRFYRYRFSEGPGERASVAEAIARNACDIAQEIGARLVVAFTENGLTARFASKARPTVPIVAFSPNVGTRRRLALLWGVVPLPIDLFRDADQMVENASAILVSNGMVSPGDKFVAVFGAPVGVAGSTNTIRVKVVE